MKYMKKYEIELIVSWTPEKLCLKPIKNFTCKKIGYNKALNVSVFKLENGAEVVTNCYGDIITCLA